MPAITDETAFLKAISAAPDDDLPRLVYADYLDDKGDARGQVIRASIAGEEVDCSPMNVWLRDYLRLERNGPAARKNAGFWQGGVVRWTWRRGFADNFAALHGFFRDKAQLLFGKLPVEHIWVTSSDLELWGMYEGPLLPSPKPVRISLLVPVVDDDDPTGSTRTYRRHVESLLAEGHRVRLVGPQTRLVTYDRLFETRNAAGFIERRQSQAREDVAGLSHPFCIATHVNLPAASTLPKYCDREWMVGFPENRKPCGGRLAGEWTQYTRPHGDGAWVAEQVVCPRCSTTYLYAPIATLTDDSDN